MECDAQSRDPHPPQMLMLHVWLAVEEVVCSYKRGLKRNQEEPNLLVSVVREADDPTRGFGVRDPHRRGGAAR